MTLPKMDMPVAIVQWELFAPERYSVRTIGGNAIDVGALDASGVAGVEGGILGGVVSGLPAAPVYRGGAIRVSFADGLPGQVRGVVRDTSGTLLPGVTIELATGATEKGLRSAVSDERGAFSVLNVPPGTVTVTATLHGFKTAGTSFGVDERPRQLEIDMAIGDLTETITVTGETPTVNTQSSTRSFAFGNVAPPPAPTPRADLPAVQPSQNVVNLQKKTAGVLPVRVDVPRAGASHRFIKPLVVDQETVVRLRYKRR
jgi:hypothetical protein